MSCFVVTQKFLEIPRRKSQAQVLWLRKHNLPPELECCANLISSTKHHVFTTLRCIAIEAGSEDACCFSNLVIVNHSQYGLTHSMVQSNGRFLGKEHAPAKPSRAGQMVAFEGLISSPESL